MKKLLLFFLLIFSLVLQSQNKIIEDIKVKGTKKTKIAFIKKIIKSKNGAVLDSIQLKEDITFLKRLPTIAHAYYQVFHSHENKYNVFIHIQENFTIIPDIAFWTALNNRFAYRLGVTEYNLFGRGISAGGYYQHNGYDTYAINFRAPNLFSRKFGLALNYQNWKSEEPLYFEEGTANYLYNNISTELLGIYQLNFNHQFTFGVSIFEENYTYLFGDISDNVPQFLHVDKVLYKLLYNYNNIDYYFQYLDGFKSELIVQYVTSVNDFQDKFIIAWNDFFHFKRIGDKGNWANRFRFGLSTNNDSPFAPFALDNNVNLRGVGILVDRGTGVIVYNTEYRHTFYDKDWLTIQGNVFMDAGSWRNPGGKLSDFTNHNNIELFSGVGLRFINKKIYNATFRIDYGHSLKDKRGGIVFGIGQYF